MKPIIITGKVNSASIYARTYQEKVEEQLREVCNQEFVRNSKICIMPDTHPGEGCVIGTSMTLPRKQVCPNLVGSDGYCGMYVLEINTLPDKNDIESVILQYVPSGKIGRESIHPLAKSFHEQLRSMKCYSQLQNIDWLMKGLGSLGTNNHYLELNFDEQNRKYLVIHTGSRNLGAQICKIYMNIALSECNKSDVNDVITRMKNEGRHSEIQEYLKSMTTPKQNPKLAYLSDYSFDNYIHDMFIVREYAILNRKIIGEEICTHLGLNIRDSFTTFHNYIDLESLILRKGAISAKKGERVIIPINRLFGSFLCVGKGNPEWNYSAPHGAGRLMSRKEAKDTLNVKEYEKEMKDAGIYATNVDESTLDESSKAYKDPEEIRELIEDTVEVTDHLKVYYNYKDGTKKALGNIVE